MIGGKMNYSMFDEIDYFTNFKGNQKIPNFQNEFNNNLNTLEYIENNNLDLYTPYEDIYEVIYLKICMINIKIFNLEK